MSSQNSGGEGDVEGADGDAPEETPEVMSLNVRQFVAARISEIASLTAQLGTTGGAQGRGKGLAFQHVSKHMRRRAVSHNPKRLPSRLQKSHLAQLRKSSGGVVKKPKRPRRKFRKRSDGDILEYNRRQVVNPKWLESHIWHAKRFHMKFIWERRLAVSPTAKCFRSLFRAARNSVIMQDVSYLETLEISGPVETLSEGMNKLVPHGFAKTPHFNRECLAHVFFPLTLSYLGPIKYLWVPLETSDHGKLLIWLHPAIKSFVVEELEKVFGLTGKETPMDFPEFPTKDEKKHLWKIINNQCWSNENNQVTLKDLNGCFNRIRLVGPKTLAILKEILKVGVFKLSESLEQSALEQQETVWKSVRKLVDIPDNTVIPLNVIDPRRGLPNKRRRVKQTIIVEPKSGDTNGVTAPQTEWQTFNQNSPLWSDDMRKLILRNKTSDEKLSRARSKNLIPGTKINDGKDADVVPIALVVRSYNSNFPGVDLILPCGWLMPFWIALSYRCVRSFALEFNDYLKFEDDRYSLDFSTTTLFSPDSIVYPQETEKTDKETRAKYFSYPPAKRQNLIKLGCAFPFSTDWSSFLRFLSSSQSQDDAPIPVQVLRKREDLKIVANCLNKLNPNHVIFNDSFKLYPVQVMLISGVVEKGACICLPNETDLNFLITGKYRDIHILQEPFKDSNEKKRAELSRLHHKRLSHLRKKRKAARKGAHRLNNSFDLGCRLEELNSKSEVDKYNEEMNNLWLNDNPQEVLSKQDREIMGFTEYGHFSFLRGKTAAFGYVTLGQLKRLIELYKIGDNFVKGKRTLHVLVRNWASGLTYHWAKLEYPRSF